MPTIRPRTAALPLLGLTIVGGLAACAAPAASTDASESAETSTTTETQTSTGWDASASEYADGTYTADGAYFSPAGPETVTVTVTLDDGIVTAVEVVGHATDPQAKSFQSDFIGGIAAEVVGQPIADLAVDRVAGSSLTGTGFNAALESIRADASS